MLTDTRLHVASSGDRREQLDVLHNLEEASLAEGKRTVSLRRPGKPAGFLACSLAALPRAASEGILQRWGLAG